MFLSGFLLWKDLFVPQIIIGMFRVISFVKPSQGNKRKNTDFWLNVFGEVNALCAFFMIFFS